MRISLLFGQARGLQDRLTEALARCERRDSSRRRRLFGVWARANRRAHRRLRAATRELVEMGARMGETADAYLSGEQLHPDIVRAVRADASRREVACH